MNKTYAIVKAWAEFEEAYPQGDLTDFCRHYLAHQNGAAAKGTENVCNDCNTHFDLSRMVNQLSRLWMHYSQAAIRPLNLLNFDEFVFLYTVDAVKDIRKKDLIYIHFIEISSGLLVIDRLAKKDFIKETIDKADKRSKRLAMTKKGIKVLAQARAAMEKVAMEMYVAMPEDDMLLCIRLLAPTLSTNAERWHQQKGFEPPLADAVTTG